MPSISKTLIAAIFAITLLSGVSAHSKGKLLVNRAEHELEAHDSLSQCSGKLHDPELLARRQAKHEAFIKDTLIGRGYLESHAAELAKRSAVTGLEARQVKCVLSPELSIGPYYVEREKIRNAIAEDQPGVPFAVDLQFFNVKNCNPIADLYVDIWHCNATGVYSGVKAENTLGKTFLRGVVKTDSDGIAHITTVFPGFYSGRAAHIHVVVHYGGQVMSDGTYQGGAISHVGQIFLPESILTEIEKTDPYNKNKNKRTLNSQDQWYTQTKSTTTGFENEINVSRLGSSLSAGLVGKLSLGVDLTKNHKICNADSNDQNCWTGPVQEIPMPSLVQTSPKVSPTTTKPTTTTTTAAPACTGAPVNLNGQCGGQYYTGSNCCTSGTKCVYVNGYYSQCRA
ncbi:hypothetical protein HK098_001302 [Nowakowskiella sp. JEL0407]|nr:hypothetical protein HK098_001302 [Nowakowskiella sp. JEL0407]